MKWYRRDDTWVRYDAFLDTDDGIETEVWPVGGGMWWTTTWYVRHLGDPTGCPRYQCLTSNSAPAPFHKTTARANANHDAHVARFSEHLRAQEARA